MLTFGTGDARAASAFLRFRRGLTDGAGDGPSRGGFGGHRDPSSLTVNGDALLPCGLGDLASALSAAFASAPRSLKEGFRDVATNVSAAGGLCGGSLRTKTPELLCNIANVG